MASNSLYLGKLRRRKEMKEGQNSSQISCICSALWFCQLYSFSSLSLRETLNSSSSVYKHDLFHINIYVFLNILSSNFAIIFWRTLRYWLIQPASITLKALSRVPRYCSLGSGECNYSGAPAFRLMIQKLEQKISGLCFHWLSSFHFLLAKTSNQI